MSDHQTIGIIGCGNMGSALAEHLVKALGAEGILVFDKDAQKKDSLVKGFGVRGARTAEELIDSIEVVIIAVKPQDIDLVLDPLKGRKDRLVISIAAGITMGYLASRLGAQVSVVRVMPNLNALVRASMTGISCGATVTPSQKETAAKIFEAVGSVVFVKEGLLNAFTALAGSGPAFIAYLMKGLEIETIRSVFVKEALGFGFDKDTAELIADKTIAGTQKILQVNFDRDIFIKKVCSKGGTTEAGMRVLEEKGRTPQALSGAIQAAGRRAAELSRRA